MDKILLIALGIGLVLEILAIRIVLDADYMAIVSGEKQFMHVAMAMITTIANLFILWGLLK